jgi:hypothetical protein
MITLPIKKKWFDMIVSGEKKEEYRDNTPYYFSRFKAHFCKRITIRLRNGYRKDSPAAICEVIPRIKTGRTEWGAEPGKKYITLCIQSVKTEGEP